MLRGGGLLIVGALVVGAYALGASKHDSKPVAPQAIVQTPAAQPVSLPAPAQPAPLPKAKPAAPPEAKKPLSLLPPSPPEQPKAGPITKQKVETVPTAAAIAALIVAASRQAYYASGRPCACPDDRMSNGRAFGSRSAYSRPGGAQPLCSASDVTPRMIEEYRVKFAKQ